LIEIEIHKHRTPLFRSKSPIEDHPVNGGNNLPDDAVEALLEPPDGLSLGDAVAGTDAGLAAAALGDTLTRAGPVLYCVRMVLLLLKSRV
jgi:hypothetical protein